MKLATLFDEIPTIQAWQAHFSRQERVLLTGMTDTSKLLALANAYVHQPDKYLYITDSQYQASELYEQLSQVIGEDAVYQFFSDDNVFASFSHASKDGLGNRIDALDFLLDREKTGIVLVPIFALRQLLAAPKDYQDLILSISMGDQLDLEAVTQQLVTMGYEASQRVMTPGEFSRRGDILDIYAMGAALPVRIEFFGDEIDGLRSFDADSQKSLETLETARILPARDFILTDEAFVNLARYLGHYETDDPILRSYLDELTHSAQNKQYHDDFRKFAWLSNQQQTTILDYFPKHGILLVDDFQKITATYHRVTQELAEFTLSELHASKGLADQVYLADNLKDLRGHLPASFFSRFKKGLGNLRFDALYDFDHHSNQQFFGQVPLIEAELKRFLQQEQTLVIAAGQQDRPAITRLLASLNLAYQDNPKVLSKRIINLVSVDLTHGFSSLSAGLVLLVSSELLGKQKKKRAKRQNITNAERLKDYNELAVGDYVVHRTHGIGRYLGLQTLEVAGLHKDYLTIEYQKGDTISVPVEHVGFLSKYLAGEGKAPKINRLNDGRWQKTLSKVTKQVEDISQDLIKLYAAREQLKGFAFSPDDESQADFDGQFPYAETDDQLRSIDEIKADMMRTRPMDRLLVGDVGFGKTEVAMRAAFKAVNDGKQVAVLVPTTVLAEQHYKNFQDRFAQFAVTIGVLSRFQTKNEQVDLLERLSQGLVDIVVGTHRLLSKDVQFKDLGLIVIDEEQRFGVKHKERLKALKQQVDALTLTATPIPRTLHMSMMGIRDLSVIETPPTDRYPVQTYVMEQSDHIIRDAALREYARGGQSFYLHNRVETIEEKVAELTELLPELEIGYAHGKMTEAQLENALLDFIQGRYDLLVSTTIIETGVDIPNANTLFVEAADYMGLSQLYQLRGRVGRSNRVAYAYLFYQPDKILTEVAEKRLDAIKGFTELGSGFKIAMRDLSLRGAGNLLGAEQSGFIDAVGFDLYTQLLEEAVHGHSGQATINKQAYQAELNLTLEAYIPSTYISDERQKIEIYKRIRVIESKVYYEDLQSELIDRFGDYPQAVANLLEVGYAKYLADHVFVQKLEVLGRELVVTMLEKASSHYLAQDYFKAIDATKLPIRLSEQQGHMVLRFNIAKVTLQEALAAFISFAEGLLLIKDEKA